MLKRPMHPLEEWRRSQIVNGKPMTMEHAAGLLGVTRAAWNDWEKRKRIPGQAIMADLYAITDGVISPNDFYDLPALDGQKDAA
jgi:transcriptional regulator with XRE-family HTH domain